MGACGFSTQPVPHHDAAFKVDYVHPLTQEQRKQRLIDGYIHSITTLKKIIPDDIKSILNLYLQNIAKIKSQTEIDDEARKRQELLRKEVCEICKMASVINFLKIYF